MIGLTVAAWVTAFVLGHPFPTSCGPLPPVGGAEPFGLTWRNPDGSAQRIELQDAFCSALSQTANPRMLGAAILVVLHESAHASGIWDETDAECQAAAWAPLTIRILFPEGGPWTEQVVAGAAGMHQLIRLGPAYSEHVCG